MAEDLERYASSLGVTFDEEPEEEIEEEEDDEGVGGLFGISKAQANAPLKWRDVAPTPPKTVETSAQADREIDQAAMGEAQQEYSTFGQALSMFFTFSPEGLSKVQKALHEKGFYPKSYYKAKNADQPSFGVPDKDSYLAFKEALLLAARKQWAQQMNG